MSWKRSLTRARHEDDQGVDDDVALVLGGHDGPEEDHPDEGVAAELLGPLEGAVEDVAGHHVGEGGQAHQHHEGPGHDLLEVSQKEPYYPH